MSLEKSNKTYAQIWDSYVLDSFPRLCSLKPHKERTLEPWRVLNTEDSTYQYPGDEWGSRNDALALLEETLFSHTAAAVTELCELGAGSGRYTELVFERFPEASVHSFDVSQEFTAILGKRFSTAAQEGRLHMRILQGNPSEIVDYFRQAGLVRKVDAFYSFDAMVHVDLHTLAVYWASAALVLRPGGGIAMNVADATNQLGMMKLFHNAGGTYRLSGNAGPQFFWISPEIVRSVLGTLGFRVQVTKGNGRDCSFYATLEDPERAEAWLQESGMHL